MVSFLGYLTYLYSNVPLYPIFFFRGFTHCSLTLKIGTAYIESCLMSAGGGSLCKKLVRILDLQKLDSNPDLDADLESREKKSS